MPRNKYPEETREKIILTSLKLFVEKGYDETTVLDIVANLGGLTRGAFYHHFKSKEEVLDAVFNDDDFEPQGFKMAREAKGLNGLERARMGLKLSLMENTKSNFHTEATRLVLQLLMQPRFLCEKIKGDINSARELGTFIAEGMADGSIPPGHPRLLAELFFLIVNFWMLPSIYPATLEEIWQKGEMLEKILEALNFPLIDEEMEQLFEQTMTTVIIPE